MALASDFDPRWSRWLAVLSFTAVLVWLAWSMVRGFWVVINEPTLPTTLESTGATTVKATPVTASISEWHLFGHGAAPRQPQQERIKLATDTGLQLLGTLASTDPLLGKAIIADVSGNQDVFSVGDELPGGGVLREVHASHAVIEINGDPRQLTMEQAVASAPRQTVPPIQKTTSVAPAVTGAQVDWNAIRSGMKLDPARLANNISVLPHMENGKQVGVRINAGRDASLLRALGLTANDVVLAVNGQKLDDPSRYLQLVNELKSAQRVNVTYRRNGKEYTRDIQIPQ